MVGAGVIGMLSALQLHSRGWRVSVFDSGSAGRESSWAGGGILSPILPWNYPEAVWQLSRRSLPLYDALAPELAEATGVDPELTASGAMLLDPDQIQAGAAWCAAAGLAAPEIDAILQTRGPSLPGLLLPWIGQIRNPRLGQALRLRLRQLGIALHENTPVTGWLRDGGRVAGVDTAAGEHRGDCVVLAAGAWSGALGALPVAPVRGQMLLLRAAPGRLKRIVLDGGRYLIPRRDGRILVGSTVESAGFDKRVTGAAREELLAFAVGLLGTEAAGQVETQWSGLRPGSADGIPYIGEHPALPGLWVNTGHYRNGLVMAPASAELLADLMEGKPTQLDAAAYRLGAGRL
ncbi:FAD-dependent oxidoreductase [Hydrocarboniphaga sp.]|uniref:NAD(P)/FAD-dependent oxidoreductase n=1 Tax=Hydrocarboniphaga sp. TaxID=2033016 RepID=UPI0034568054